jgi:hypothetical protein
MQDHQVVMCQECANAVHKGCSISTVANAVAKKKENLKQADAMLQVSQVPLMNCIVLEKII